MKRFGMVLASLALTGFGTAASARQHVAAIADPTSLAAPVSVSAWSDFPNTGWRPPVWGQVRIERRFSIRISPGTAAMPLAVVEELEEIDRVERLQRRRMNKCLALAAIAAVRPGDGNELLLFMRDPQIVSVALEKHCHARDFYSGFYVARNADGALCPARDLLQSRSGAICKVKRLNELVAAGYRAIP